MANGHIGNVSKTTFVSADQKTRDGLIFDVMEAVHDMVMDNCERISALENRRRIDTGVAAASGVLGGFLAILTKKLW